MFQLPCSIFIFINKVNFFFFFFFFDWSVTDAVLFFEALTQPGILTDDAVRLLRVHVIAERNFYLINLAIVCQISHGIAWTGDKS